MTYFARLTREDLTIADQAPTALRTRWIVDAAAALITKTDLASQPGARPRASRQAAAAGRIYLRAVTAAQAHNPAQVSDLETYTIEALRGVEAGTDRAPTHQDLVYLAAASLLARDVALPAVDHMPVPSITIVEPVQPQIA